MVRTTAGNAVSVNLPFINYPITAPQLQTEVFINNFPMSHTDTLSTTQLKIMPTRTPTVTTIINFAVLIITRKFINDFPALIYNGMDLSNALGITYEINNPNTLNPSTSNTFFGITQYLASGPGYILNTYNFIDYDLGFSYPGMFPLRTLYLQFSFTGMPVSFFKATFFTYQDIGIACPGFIQYTGPLFITSPQNCSVCN